MKFDVRSGIGSDFIRLHQNIKKDPEGFIDEVTSYFTECKANLESVKICPGRDRKELADIVIFLSQVSSHYKKVLKDFPKSLIEILDKYGTEMHSELRQALCRGLILLRNRNMLPPLDTLTLFFDLLRCQDKTLRIYLQNHIVSDITNLNSRHQNNQVNTPLQNFMFKKITEENKKAVKMSLDIMTSLYRKNVWRNIKTVNVIASACFSPITSVMVAALKFFLTADENKEQEKDSDDDEAPNIKDVMMANRVNKKSKKRKMMVKKTKKQIKKSKKKSKAPTFTFSAIQMLHDPQNMAEKLLSKVRTLNESFEVKLLMMELISRLIGIHELLVPNFYPYIDRLIQPHQREVTKILLYLAQASHALVTPEDLQFCVKNIAHNFVNERSSVEVMTVGLNAIREVCARCPLAITEDLLQDLVQYRHHRQKNVYMAANSLMKLYRDINPNWLARKDRGKPTQAQAELEMPVYGELRAKDFIPGAEVLEDDSKGKTSKNKEKSQKEDSEEDIEESNEEEDLDEEEEDLDEAEEDFDEAEEDLDEAEEESEEASDEDEKKEETKEDSESDKKEFVLREVAAAEDRAKAVELSHNRIFSQEDHRRMDAAKLAKQVQGTLPRKLKKRKAEELEEEDEEVSGSEEEGNPGGLPTLEDIERIHKRVKVDRETRLATAMKEKESKPKFTCKLTNGKNNRVKKKNKPFTMIKHKLKSKQKRSYREKAMDLKKSLMKQKKARR